MGRKKNFDIIGKATKALSSKPEEHFDAKQVAWLIYEMFPSDCDAKRERSDNISSKDALIQQIAREWHSYWRTAAKRDPKIRATETRPRKFYYSSKSEEAEIQENEVTNKKNSTQSHKNNKLSEHDLYPLLGEYIHDELQCMSMRINEAKSSNSHGPKGNEWLFPDVVGMIDLSDGWHPELLDLADSLSTKKVRLCSFEVKLAINRSNVRKVVFQTISNSSWANQSYLVAASLDSKAADELRMLCIAHGVGFILLDSEEPLESQVLIPAKFNDKVNYDSLNRLVTENKDAQEYLELVTTFLKTKKLRTNLWDLVPNLKE